MIRNKLKGLCAKDRDIPPDTDVWYTGADVPVTWEPEELKILRFRCYRENYLRGNISKEEYLSEKERLRNG